MVSKEFFYKKVVNFKVEIKIHWDLIIINKIEECKEFFRISHKLMT